MCPPTPPCGLSLICSQSEKKEAERSKERGKCEVWCANTVANASKLTFLNEFKEVLMPSVCRGWERERETGVCHQYLVFDPDTCNGDSLKEAGGAGGRRYENEEYSLWHYVFMETDGF